MAIYREGYEWVSEIEKASEQIFADACDYGVPVNIGDKNWNMGTSLIEMYGIDGTRSEDACGVTADIELIDEWAVSDESKTVAEATEKYKVSYTKCKHGKCKGYMGYLTVEKY